MISFPQERNFLTWIATHYARKRRPPESGRGHGRCSWHERGRWARLKERRASRELHRRERASEGVSDLEAQRVKSSRTWPSGLRGSDEFAPQL
jgi:hypothetical protein